MTAVKLNPISITNILRANGLTIAKCEPKRGIRVSGVSVSKFGRAIVLQYQDWAKTGERETAIAQAQQVLAGYGLQATAVSTNGRYTGLYTVGR